MAVAGHDGNFVPSLTAKSSANDGAIVDLWADPTTHRLLVDNANTMGITVGSTTITGGTSGRVLYDNAGVVGEYTISGTGSVAMTNSPVFTTPNIGTATGSITGNAATVTTNANLTGVITSVGNATSIASQTGTGTKFVVDNTPTLITPNIGVATATSVNGLTITSSTGTFTLTNAKTFSVSKTMSFTAADDTGAYTLPTGTKTLLATDGAGTGLSGIPYTLTGTANQVVLSAGTGNITFSLPQSIATSSNPQFATIELGAASDTTLARVSGGVVSIEGVRVITSAGTTSGTILKNNGTTFVASTETYATPGTSGNILTSDGTNWTSAAPSTGTPTMNFSTAFETAARFGSNASGATAAFDGDGLTLDTTATGSRYYQALAKIINVSNHLEIGSPVFSASVEFSTIGTDMASFFGLNNFDVGAATFDYTKKHIGFKVTRAASGTINLSATQGNGTTENTTVLTTVAQNDQLDLILKVNGTSSVDYYWRKNGGAISSATNLTSNFPTGVGPRLNFAIGNQTVASDSTVIIRFASYQR